MRPEILQIGTCTTAVPSMVGPNGLNYFDTGNYEGINVQLINPDNNWTAGTVAVQGSLDGGTTWGTIQTATGPGFYVMPDAVLGRVRAVASGLPANTTIDVWLGGRNLRADY
jgi:hypothetical protein